MYKLAAPRSYQYLATFFSIQQTSFAPKNGWGMLVNAPLLTIASFEVIPSQKLVGGKTNENSPLKTGCPRPLLKKSSSHAVFVGYSVTPMSTLANNKRSRSKS
jgi:hypothetical protein|tara:strand:+ start:224 stop:532 length:309 start_codon:yes stop_codon:yes gene_type:complete